MFVSLQALIVCATVELIPASILPYYDQVRQHDEAYPIIVLKTFTDILNSNKWMLPSINLPPFSGLSTHLLDIMLILSPYTSDKVIVDM